MINLDLQNIHLFVWATQKSTLSLGRDYMLRRWERRSLEAIVLQFCLLHGNVQCSCSLCRCGADLVIKRLKLFHVRPQNSRCGRVEPVASPHSAAEVVCFERWWFSAELLIRVYIKVWKAAATWFCEKPYSEALEKPHTTCRAQQNSRRPFFNSVKGS